MRAWRVGSTWFILALLVLSSTGAWAGETVESGPVRSRATRDLGYPRGNWGAGRCSSTSCHGSPTPVFGSRILRNEHTVWASRDPHAGAFQTLNSELSRSIARKLGQSGGRFIPAHLDQRCLACHSTPGAAVNPEYAATIRQDGVGCEACHGASESWMAQHTTYDWDALNSAEKETRYGKVRLDDLTQRGERCVGCHVGLPAQSGRPAREVNHDLIAAGHPRLNFELTSFLANLPAHWVETGRNSAADFPARAWVVGQLVSARTALELLQSRAQDAVRAGSNGPSSWPEFAEYDCASCHQDLRSHNPASLSPEPGPGRVGTTSKSGLPAWGTWYYPMISTLAPPAPTGETTAWHDCLEHLQALMAAPLPEAGSVANEAGKAVQALDRWLGRLERDAIGTPSPEALVQVLRARTVEPLEPSGPGWDFEAQVFLGLVPLRQSLSGAARSDPVFLAELRDRRQRLLAPFAPVPPEPIGATRRPGSPTPP